MRGRPEKHDAIWALADAAVNETLSAADVAALRARLEADPAARQLYLEYCELHAGLRFAVEPVEAMREILARIGELPRSEPLRRSAGTSTTDDHAVSSPRDPRKSSPWWSPAMTAADRAAMVAVVATTTLLLSILGVLGMLRWPGDTAISVAQPGAGDRAHSITPQPAPLREVAATLTGQIDCRWAEGLTAPSYGEPLYEGREIVLESGLAQLTFESGAKLILQAPARFQVVSAMEGRLNVGKLAAIIPRPAYGFSVRTPTAEIIDLGTEFGVEVQPSGRTEVHVFNGEVVSRRIERKGSGVGENRYLVENESSTFNLGEEFASIGKANADKFVRQVFPRLTEDQLPPLPLKNDLVLWLAADTIVNTDASGRVIAWRDILAGDNQAEDDAWQSRLESRPLLVDHAIGGKPALRFDGQSDYLVTTPIDTTDDQTVFVVCAFGPGSIDRDGRGQLINYNGPPQRWFVKRGSPGVLQIGDVDMTAPDGPGAGFLRGFVYAGKYHPKERGINVGRIITDRQIEVGQPIVCTYVYDGPRDRSELFVNGASHGVETAPVPIAVNSRKVIGRHAAQDFYFLGDIAEVLIYNAGLQPDQLHAVNEYLATKYAIKLAP